MAPTTDPLAAAAGQAASSLIHLPVTGATLVEASIYAGITVALFLTGLLLPAGRRRGLLASAALAMLMLLSLWFLSRFGQALANATLYDIVRETLLALLAFAVIRAALLFAIRGLLAGIAVPRILADVLLTLALIAYALYRLNVIGVNLAGIVTTSAVITGAIAFSAQEILGALWAGLALQGERTLRQGDWIRYNDRLCQVVESSWRSTAVATCDNETIIIPNASLMKERIMVVGRHGEETSALRRHIPFSVSYATPPGEVSRALDEAFARAEIPNVARLPAPYCACKAFEASGIGYELLYHINDLQHYTRTDSAVLAQIYAALARNGMTIPYPQMVVQDAKETPEYLERVDRDERDAVLGKIGLFSSLTLKERNLLAGALERCPFTRNEIVFRQGDAADSLLVLARGRLDVFHEDGQGERCRLATLEAPAYLGEMGLLLGQPRGATIRSPGDALCYRLNRSAFDAIIRARPEMVEDLSRVLAQRQAENDATLQALDAESRARQTVNRATELVRMIRGFFRIGDESKVRSA